MPPSKEELLAIVRQYYASTNAFHFTTQLSPEDMRLQAVWRQWIANMAPWKGFIEALRSTLPNYRIGELTPSDDGGPSCTIRLPKESRTPTANWAVVGCISLLAPVYFVYGVTYDYLNGRVGNQKASFEPPPPNMSAPAQVLARTIETMYGYSALPRELLDTPVPLYAGSLEPHQTTLFHTLFTNQPGNIP